MPDPENVYAPPSANLDGTSPFGKNDHASELAAFVGKNSSFYLEKWAHKIKGGEGSSGFSVGAFFLGILSLAIPLLIVFGFVGLVFLMFALFVSV